MKNKYVKSITPLFFVFMSNAVLAEQSCEGTTETTLFEDFVISDDLPNILTHSNTGLTWARCAVGQTWDTDTLSCDGNATRFTWQEALALANSYTLEGKTDWRLPNMKELVSIVERNCVTPSTNATLFPNTPEDSFWSSSSNTSASKTDEAWAVSFINGRLDSREKSVQQYYVRMVRYAE